MPRDTKSKRLRIPPDKSFLEDITSWRAELAKDIYKRNPDLNVKLLNDVVQKLLDRIVFIRIAEDRKIRPDRELWEIVAQWKEEGKRKPIMTHLKDLFKDRFGRNQNIGIQEQIKLCVPRLVDKLYAAYDSEGNHYLDNVDVGGITLNTEYRHLDYKYLLAFLNSELLRWYFPFVSLSFRGGWLSANRQFLSQLPIRPIDFNSPSEKAIHDKLVTLVDRMLELYKKKDSLPPSAERERVEREIAVTDEKIDDIVYWLYGITEEERGMIEGVIP